MSTRPDACWSRCRARTCSRRYEFPGRRVVRALVTVPFVLPTVVVGSAFVGLLGPGGPLAGARSRPDGVGDPARPRLLQLRGRGAHRRRALGAPRPAPGGGGADARRRPRWRAFREVTLPALRPAIAAAAAIVFLFTFTSFGVILILGGPRFATLETEIYRQTAQLLEPRRWPPRSPSCSSSPSWCCSWSTGRIEGRQQRRAAAARGARDRRAAPRTAAERVLARRQPRGDGRAARRADAGARRAVAAPARRLRLRLLPRARRRATRAARCSCRRCDAIGNSLRFAAIATVHRGGRRRVRGVRAGARHAAARPRRARCRCRSACRR